MSARLSFSQTEFQDSLREHGFLSDLIEEARPHFAHLHPQWFPQARSLNHEALLAFHRREDAVIGRTAHDPICLATRLMMRTLNSFQGAIILYERGMSAEGDTLARGVFEIAFWIGFLNKKTRDCSQHFPE